MPPTTDNRPRLIISLSWAATSSSASSSALVFTALAPPPLFASIIKKTPDYAIANLNSLIYWLNAYSAMHKRVCVSDATLQCYLSSIYLPPSLLLSCRLNLVLNLCIIWQITFFYTSTNGIGFYPLSLRTSLGCFKCSVRSVARVVPPVQCSLFRPNADYTHFIGLQRKKNKKNNLIKRESIWFNNLFQHCCMLSMVAKGRKISVSCQWTVNKGTPERHSLYSGVQGAIKDTLRFRLKKGKLIFPFLNSNKWTDCNV